MVQPPAPVSRSIPYVDSVAKVTGSAQYAADVQFPNLLIGRVLRSPHAHARILHIDVSAAKSLPGVKAVITGDDCPEILHGPMAADKYILARGVVRYIGEEVAAVAAVDDETADEALRLIRVDYEPLPALLDLASAVAANAMLVHDTYPGNIASVVKTETPGFEDAMRSADVVLTETFDTSMMHQCYIEPNCSVARLDSSGKLTMWIGTQAAFSVREILSQALRMPESDIQIVQTFTGGGFGGKSWQTSWPICAALALHTDAPVQLKLSREEEFEAAAPRVPMWITLTMGASRDGALVFKDASILAQNGAYSHLAPAVLSVAAVRYDSLYRLHNVRVNARLIYTHTVPTGPMRGFGNPQMHFAGESMMDMLAEAVGIDPMEIRLRNAARAGDTSVYGWRLGNCALVDTIHRAVDAIGMHEKRDSARVARGVGIASGIHVSSNRGSYGPYDGSSARVQITPDGHVILTSGEADLGQGSRTVHVKVAAETLGIPVAWITVSGVDTDVSPYAIGTFGSRVTVVGGKAVQMAALDARRQLLQAVADDWGVAPDRLHIVDGRVCGDDECQRNLPFSAAAELAADYRHGQPIEGIGEYRVPDVVIPDPVTLYGNISSAYAFATHAADVEVDLDTGRVHLLDYVAAHDIGYAVNQLGVEGQIEGGAVMGIGMALLEELKTHQGRIVNGSFLDYRMPTAVDVPKIKTILIEPNCELGLDGAKSVGELAHVPSAAAIANAVSGAIGVRFTSLPITPDKILAALKRKEKAASEGQSQ